MMTASVSIALVVSLAGSLLGLPASGSVSAAVGSECVAGLVFLVDAQTDSPKGSVFFMAASEAVGEQALAEPWLHAIFKGPDTYPQGPDRTRVVEGGFDGWVDREIGALLTFTVPELGDVRIEVDLDGEATSEPLHPGFFLSNSNASGSEESWFSTSTLADARRASHVTGELDDHPDVEVRGIAPGSTIVLEPRVWTGLSCVMLYTYLSE